jgi:hypothetical protein
MLAAALLDGSDYDIIVVESIAGGYPEANRESPVQTGDANESKNPIPRYRVHPRAN